MTRIEAVLGREVFDSRGKPTVEVEIRCAGGLGRAIMPSGASTGRFEAVELRDGDPLRLDGDGVQTAVANVNGPIAAALSGANADDQQAIDRLLLQLDGSNDKSRLGANALLGASLAAAHAAACAKRIPLVEHLHEVWRGVASESTGHAQPRTDSAPPGGAAAFILPLPMVNMISGGRHAGGNLDFQDFLILPVGAQSYRQALDWTVTVYRRLGRILADSGYDGVLIGDEGGYGPKLQSNEQAVEFVLRGIEAAGLLPGSQVCIGLDVASSQFFDGVGYRLRGQSTDRIGAAELTRMLESWVERYPIVSIEDGMAEDDWGGWKVLSESLRGRVQLIGDDLFVTNRERIRRGAEAGVADSVLIKVNQAGTLWETLEAMRTAIDHGYRPVISARSGETEDATIADLAVATGAGQIKIGSVSRSERLAKYNQLLRIEEQLGARAIWLGGSVRGGLAGASGGSGID